MCFFLEEGGGGGGAVFVSCQGSGLIGFQDVILLGFGV